MANIEERLLYLLQAYIVPNPKAAITAKHYESLFTIEEAWKVRTAAEEKRKSMCGRHNGTDYMR